MKSEDTDLSVPSQQPTGELPPGLIPEDAGALQELADVGWGEGDAEDAGVPEDFWDAR